MKFFVTVFFFLFSLGCGITRKKFIVASQCFNPKAKHVPWNQFHFKIIFRASSFANSIPRATRLTVFLLKKEKNEVKIECIVSLYKSLL